MAVRIQKDTIDFDFNRPEFKIITYIDSAGCTTCRLKLDEWTKFINSLNPISEVGFLMILTPQYQKEVEYSLRAENFLYPVMMDPEAKFKRLNQLPPKGGYNTFLLDYDNKIVAVGNPATNPKIRELYRRLIMEGTDPIPSLKICDNPSIAIGVVQPGDTIDRKFVLANHTDSLLTLQEAVPSCFCVSSSVSSPNILPGDSVEVNMRFIPDSIPGPVQRHVDLYFHEKEYPQRLTLSGYVTL